jgi:hypothetical protein
MTASKRFRLDAGVKLGEPIGPEWIEHLVEVLRVQASTWCSDVVLWEGPRRSSPLKRWDALSVQGLLDRRSRGTFAALELRNATSDALTVVIWSEPISVRKIGESWHWANTVTLQLRRSRAEGRPSEDLALDSLAALCTSPAVVYGFARMSDEYRASNLDELGGVRAIGLDISRHLPGLYWANYFGPPYVSLIGGHKLMSAPAVRVDAIGPGVLLLLAEDPRTWSQPSYMAKKRAVVESLGPEYFFDRTAPDRATRGLDISELAAPRRSPMSE